MEYTQRQPGRQLGNIETWRRTQNEKTIPKKELRRALHKQLGAPHVDMVRSCSRQAFHFFSNDGQLWPAAWILIPAPSTSSSSPFIASLLNFSHGSPLPGSPPGPRDLSKLEIVQVLFFIIFTEQHLCARKCIGTSEHKVQKKGY